MGLGLGIILVAVGAVFTFAVKVNPTGGALDLNTIGWILVGVSALGIVLSMEFWSSWAGPGRFSRRTTDVGSTGDTRTSTIEQRYSETPRGGAHPTAGSGPGEPLSVREAGSDSDVRSVSVSEQRHQ